MVETFIGILIAFGISIVVVTSARYRPEAIDDRIFTRLSDRDTRNLENLKRRVTTAKLHRDGQNLVETAEVDRLMDIKNELKFIVLDSEKKAKRKELLISEYNVEREKRKSTIAKLELSCAVAALERQKARIAIAQSGAFVHTEDHDYQLRTLEAKLRQKKTGMGGMQTPHS